MYRKWQQCQVKYLYNMYNNLALHILLYIIINVMGENASLFMRINSLEKSRRTPGPKVRLNAKTEKIQKAMKLYKEGNMAIAEICEAFAVSTGTFFRWKKIFEEEKK